MQIKIAKQLLNAYPKTEIGYVIATVSVKKQSDYTNQLKDNLSRDLETMTGVNKKNYNTHNNILGWRKIFQDMAASKDQRSSVEALVRRTVDGNKIWNISNVVDLYNYCSVVSLMPMGGYDLKKIKGNISLRYGANGEEVAPLGTKDKFNVNEKQVVYADDEKVICWLWNYRDSKFSCIDETTSQAIFFLDSGFEPTHWPVTKAIQFFSEKLTHLECSVHEYGILNNEQPIVNLNLSEIFSKILTIAPPTILLPEKSFDNKNDQQSSIKNVAPIVPTPVALEELATVNFAINFSAGGDFESLKKILAIRPQLAKCVDWFNCNPLMHSARGDHADIIKFLLDSKFGIDPNAQNNAGNTALMIACTFNLEKAVSVLLAYPNINMNIKNTDGKTALTIAQEKGYSEIVAKLTTYQGTCNNSTVDDSGKNLENNQTIALTF